MSPDSNHRGWWFFFSFIYFFSFAEFLMPFSLGWYIWHMFGKCLSHHSGSTKQVLNIGPRLFQLRNHPSFDKDWNIPLHLSGSLPIHPPPQAAHQQWQGHSLNLPPHPQPTTRRSQIWLLWLWDATGLDQESVKIPGIDKTTHAKGVKTGQRVAITRTEFSSLCFG